MAAGWSVPCVSIRLTLSQTALHVTPLCSRNPSRTPSLPMRPSTFGCRPSLRQGTTTSGCGRSWAGPFHARCRAPWLPRRGESLGGISKYGCPVNVSELRNSLLGSSGVGGRRASRARPATTRVETARTKGISTSTGPPHHVYAPLYTSGACITTIPLAPMRV